MLKRAIIPVVLATMALTSVNAQNFNKRISTLASKMELEIQRLQAPEPSLNAPMMLPEPAYTWGTSNTLYWYGDDVRSEMSSLGFELLEFELEVIFVWNGDNVILWGFAGSDKDSVCVPALPEGISIQYKLRYWAKSGDNQYLVSHWSDTVESIQDVRPPVIDITQSAIQDVQILGQQQWVIGDLLAIRIVASDSIFGRVALIGVEEVGSGVPLVHPFLPTSVHVDTIVEQTLVTPAKTPFTIRIWVKDVAGQISDTLYKHLIWWPDEDGVGKLTCFPNPFSISDMSEPLKIRVGVPGIIKARIFDPFGNLITVLTKNTSDEFFSWDGLNGNGQRVASGGYICVADGHTDLYCKIAVIR
ncbi:hypothetical protein KAR48_05505 [bacterium]|nr:hypothetical protein [bacterium]